MISENEVLEIHAILIERFGGSDGVRDKELLDSALNRPYQTFDGQELFQHQLTKLLQLLKV
jgi:death-on-curing protein